MSSAKPITIALSNTITPAIAVEIVPLGATVHSILLNADGETNDIVQGPLDPAEHGAAPYKFMNTIVGRYSNRLPVKEGGHQIERNGISATVTPVKNENDRVSLHGGPNALDTVVFDKIDTKDSVLFGPRELEALKRSDFSHALLTATMADGNNGFPGTLRVEVMFVTIEPSRDLTEAAATQIELGAVLIIYRARLAEPGKVTPINLTQHWGFNLENSLRNDRDLIIRNHRLTLKSPGILEIDEVMLPTGQLVANAGTPHEHAGKKIGENYPNPGYDNFYLFSKQDYDASIATQPTRPAVSKLPELDLLSELLSAAPTTTTPVEIWSEKSNYKLRFSSNQGGVQFYTAIGQSGAGTRKRIHGGGPGESGYPKEGAAYLEFHDPLAAFLHPQLGIDSLLTSDELYHNYVKVNISWRPQGQPSA